MEVTKELRDTIHEAVIIALDAYAQDKDVDVYLVDAIEEVLREINVPKAAAPGLVPVRYVGHRPRYSDGNWDTGWWDKDQVKMIVDSVATKMLVHRNVYVKAEAEDGSEIVQSEEKTEEIDPLQSARDAVMAMTRKAAVAEFVSANYRGLQIPADYSGNLSQMKAFAVQQMDIYGLP
jgi:hypothetical protein